MVDDAALLGFQASVLCLVSALCLPVSRGLDVGYPCFLGVGGSGEGDQKGVSKTALISGREVFDAAEVFFFYLGVKDGNGCFLSGMLCAVECLISVFPLSVS